MDAVKPRANAVEILLVAFVIYRFLLFLVGTRAIQIVVGLVIEGAHEGLIYIDNSTIKPETARMIAEKLAAVGIPA